MTKATRAPRIALYSHDALGLGHIRRNLAIATALAKTDPTPALLLFAGIAEAATLPRPPEAEVIVMPSVVKGSDGKYQSRHLSVDLATILEMRSKTLTATLRAYQPDLLIVDKHPRGFRDELVPALTELKARGKTTMVLGLRDVLDSPANALQDWYRDNSSEAISRWYQQVWVYGDRNVYDLTDDLGLPPQIMSAINHVGYLAHGRPKTSPDDLPNEPYVLGIVGGGSDGFELAQAFVEAQAPNGETRFLICGPQMPPSQMAQLQEVAKEDPTLRILNHVPDALPWIASASAVVAMGGYNTVCECFSSKVPVLIVPRVTPRQEQLVRARAMANQGLLEYLHPEALSPSQLTGWLARAVAPEYRPAQSSVAVLNKNQAWQSPAPSIDLKGLSRVAAIAQELLSEEPAQDASEQVA